METVPITVYYDHACPLCREEIFALKALDTFGYLILVDCSSSEFADEATTQAGLSQITLKQSLHVLDATGQWHQAVDAFVVMYEAIGIHSLATALNRKGLRNVLDWLYPRLVRHRHKLKWIGGHKLMPWIIRRAASRQAKQAAGCANRAHSCSSDNASR